MRLSRLEIQNYKSLRDVAIEPGPLSAFVGPNAAGKTNLVDAIDFLGDVYRWGPEMALNRRGGYESIHFRSARRSRGPIRFRIVLEDRVALMRPSPETAVRIDHSFELRALPEVSEPRFAVALEEIVVSSREAKVETEILRIVRQKEKAALAFIDIHKLPAEAQQSLLLLTAIEIGPAELALSFVRKLLHWLGPSTAGVSSVKVLQLSPQQCREPSPSALESDLDRAGGNLPAVLRYLKRKHRKEFSLLLDLMTQVNPSIEDLETDFTPAGALGLFVKERHSSRSWSAADMSDGTLQAIALLAASLDPRSKLVVIEEPENGIHPWAIRTFSEAVRIASAKKQIFITTHSPILIDRFKPEEIWIVQRPGTETKVDPVLALDPSLQEAWIKGAFTLSDYLDSGAMPEAVPAFSE